jgi:hypothetical protein
MIAEDFYNVPKFTIDLAGMIAPIEIVHAFNRKYPKYLGYVYCIKYKGLVIKYGMSNNTTESNGDRVYSQLGHLSSWGLSHLSRGAGSEFFHIINDVKLTYNIDLDHRYMTITVWDFSTHTFKALDRSFDLRWFEAELIRRYKESVGGLPIGNLKSESNVLTKSYIPADAWDSMFDTIESA